MLFLLELKKAKASKLKTKFFESNFNLKKNNAALSCNFFKKIYVIYIYIYIDAIGYLTKNDDIL